MLLSPPRNYLSHAPVAAYLATLRTLPQEPGGSRTSPVRANSPPSPSPPPPWPPPGPGWTRNRGPPPAGFRLGSAEMEFLPPPPATAPRPQARIIRTHLQLPPTNSSAPASLPRAPVAT
ncbi:unnamed protein product [Rangifer tarandus platyrhynchus]|uniref:Uncharacterized protein n=3 Tax=Rangifer tarandus platyrhynchus TaxID=3082113 RepID=A0ABN8ZWS6_RANTA|nr:unnamed protein product [Rangifer tarandus platyrhynchus]CAI9710251.1 unnamed protein product [Rangifer tarandus platyrhynchus]